MPWRREVIKTGEKEKREEKANCNTDLNRKQVDK